MPAVDRRIHSTVFDLIPTPGYAVRPLVKFFNSRFEDKKPVIWECAGMEDRRSEITREFQRAGYRVVQTSKSDNDFLRDTPSFHFDVIVTNPPYSIKNDFIRRAIEFGRPFAFLIPVDSVCGIERHKLYRQWVGKGHRISILALNNRIDFMGKGNPHSYSIWLLGDLTEHNEYLMADVVKVDTQGENGVNL